MVLRSQPIPLQFPIGGINENTPYAAPPGQTTVRPGNMLNMRAYDAIERRNRGGQRTGISRVSDTQLNGSNQVQLLEPVVEAIDLIQAAAWGDKFSAPTFNTANAGMIEWRDNTRFALLDGGSTPTVTVFTADASAQTVTNTGHTLNSTDFIGSQTPQYVHWSADGQWLFSVGSNVSNFTLSAFPYDTTTGFNAAGRVDATVPAGSLNEGTGLDVSPDGAVVFVVSRNTPYIHAYPWTGSAFGTKYADPSVVPFSGTTNSTRGYRTASINADGDIFVATTSTQMEAYNWDNVTGFGTKFASPAFLSNSGGSTQIWIEMNPGTTALARSVATSLLEIHPFNKSTGWGTRITDSGDAHGDANFNPDGNILLCSTRSAPRMDLFPFTGTSVDAPLTAPSTVTSLPQVDAARLSPNGLMIAVKTDDNTEGVAAFAFVPAGTNPTAREQRVVGVSGGTVLRSSTDLASWSTVSGGSAALSSENPQILADTAFQRLYFADGIFANYQFLDFSNNTMTDWTAALTSGSLPRGTTDTSLGCRFVAVYRGRVVLSGLQEEPQNWFMSAAGDPLNWNYSPSTPSATQAVAGNNSDAGELGDILTALAPYQDDVLIMGGANSVWVMRGDPAAGGRIDNITRGIGIVGPEAWCFDNGGNFYFMGVNGLYRMQVGAGSPDLVSRGKLDRTLSNIDTTNRIIRLAYDSRWQGVGIFVSGSATDSTPADQFFYDERNDAFFRDQYPIDIGPSAIAPLFDVNPENNTVLLGGFDSRVRKFDDAVNNDDSTAIESFMRLPIIHPALTMGQLQLTDMQLTLGQGGGSSTVFDIYQGNTPEEAALAAASGFTATLASGRNLPFRKRLRANALSMRVRNNTLGETWAYEAGTALVAGVGRIRAPL